MNPRGELVSLRIAVKSNLIAETRGVLQHGPSWAVRDLQLRQLSLCVHDIPFRSFLKQFLDRDVGQPLWNFSYIFIFIDFLSQRTESMRSVSALDHVVDSGLGAGLDAGDPIAHGVDAGLWGVNLNDLLEGGLASLELSFPVFALGLAKGDNILFGIFSSFDWLLNEVIVFKVGLKSVFHDHPSRGEPSGNSSSHFY